LLSYYIPNVFFNVFWITELKFFLLQKDTWNILIACVLGIIIGLALNHLFTIPKTCPVSNGVDIESVKLASHNIVDTCKELTNGKNKHSFIRGSNLRCRSITHLNSYF